MTDWITVFSLVGVGLLFIIVEVLFVPGTTVVGMIGLAVVIVGIYLSFTYFGSPIGLGVLLGSTVFSAMVFYYSFRGKTWERFSLKTAIDSKVNEGLTGALKTGEEGKALSSLKPVGKAMFEGREYEVQSEGGYIDTGTKVRIIKINNHKIFVKPID